jgi:hypothetical protein
MSSRRKRTRGTGATSKIVLKPDNPEKFNDFTKQVKEVISTESSDQRNARFRINPIELLDGTAAIPVQITPEEKKQLKQKQRELDDIGKIPDELLVLAGDLGKFTGKDFVTRAISNDSKYTKEIMNTKLSLDAAKRKLENLILDNKDLEEIAKLIVDWQRKSSKARAEIKKLKTILTMQKNWQTSLKDKIPETKDADTSKGTEALTPVDRRRLEKRNSKIAELEDKLQEAADDVEEAKRMINLLREELTTKETGKKFLDKVKDIIRYADDIVVEIDGKRSTYLEYKASARKEIDDLQDKLDKCVKTFRNLLHESSIGQKKRKTLESEIKRVREDQNERSNAFHYVSEQDRMIKKVITDRLSPPFKKILQKGGHMPVEDWDMLTSSQLYRLVEQNCKRSMAQSLENQQTSLIKVKQENHESVQVYLDKFLTKRSAVHDAWLQNSIREVHLRIKALVNDPKTLRILEAIVELAKDASTNIDNEDNFSYTSGTAILVGDHATQRSFIGLALYVAEKTKSDTENSRRSTINLGQRVTGSSDGHLIEDMDEAITWASALLSNSIDEFDDFEVYTGCIPMKTMIDFAVPTEGELADYDIVEYFILVLHFILNGKNIEPITNLKEYNETNVNTNLVNVDSLGGHAPRLASGFSLPEMYTDRQLIDYFLSGLHSHFDPFKNALMSDKVRITGLRTNKEMYFRWETRSLQMVIYLTTEMANSCLCYEHQMSSEGQRKISQKYPEHVPHSALVGNFRGSQPPGDRNNPGNRNRGSGNKQKNGKKSFKNSGMVNKFRNAQYQRACSEITVESFKNNCFKCGKPGHYARDCDKYKSFLQQKGTDPLCSLCGAKHLNEACPLNKANWKPQVQENPSNFKCPLSTVGVTCKPSCPLKHDNSGLKKKALAAMIVKEVKENFDGDGAKYVEAECCQHNLDKEDIMSTKSIREAPARVYSLFK